MTVRIFSGIRSIRLFGAKTVRFRGAGRKVVCIRVPFRAKTFDARTKLRVSLAVALDAGASPRPKSRPITLTPRTPRASAGSPARPSRCRRGR